MSFPERFQEILDSRNLTTYRVAKESGLSEALLGFWRRGDKVPTLDKLTILADHFNVSIDYLVGRSNDPTLHSPANTDEPTLRLIARNKHDTTPPSDDVGEKITARMSKAAKDAKEKR